MKKVVIELVCTIDDLTWGVEGKGWTEKEAVQAALRVFKEEHEAEIYAGDYAALDEIIASIETIAAVTDDGSPLLRWMSINDEETLINDVWME